MITKFDYNWLLEQIRLTEKEIHYRIDDAILTGGVLFLMLLICIICLIFLYRNQKIKMKKLEEKINNIADELELKNHAMYVNYWSKINEEFVKLKENLYTKDDEV